MGPPGRRDGPRGHLDAETGQRAAWTGCGPGRRDETDGEPPTARATAGQRATWTGGIRACHLAKRKDGVMIKMASCLERSGVGVEPLVYSWCIGWCIAGRRQGRAGVGGVGVSVVRAYTRVRERHDPSTKRPSHVRRNAPNLYTLYTTPSGTGSSYTPTYTPPLHPIHHPYTQEG